MRHLSLLYLFLFGLLCEACKPEQNALLTTAWETVENEPQKVIDMLDTCRFSWPSLRAQRAWLLSRAYDKCDVNIADDSLIMQAVKYYKLTRNEKMFLRSLYCLGRVQMNAGDDNNAMMSFEQTADMARKRKDWFWLGLSTRNMATIYNNAYCFEKGTQCAEETVYAFTQSRDSLYLAYAQLTLARSYRNLSKDTARDSLLSLLLAQHFQDSLLIGEIHKTQARAFLLHSYPPYEEAYKHYMLCPQKVLGVSDWCNLLIILAGMGKKDEDYTRSLLHQIGEIAHQSNGNGVQAKYALYRYHKLTGDYEAALPYFEKVMAHEDSLLREKIQQSLVFTQKEHYKQQSLQEKRKRERLLSFSIWGALLAALGAAVLFQRNKRQKRQIEAVMLQAEESREQYERLRQDSFQKEIETLSQLAKEYYEGGTQHQQQVIIDHFMNQLKSFREFNAELPFLEEDINFYKDQAMTHFRQEFPGMSKHGYKMATVFFSGLPNALIGLLMNKSTPTVRSERSQLKKRISDSTAPHKEDFLSLLDNYTRKSVDGQS